MQVNAGIVYHSEVHITVNCSIVLHIRHGIIVALLNNAKEKLHFLLSIPHVFGTCLIAD